MPPSKEQDSIMGQLEVMVSKLEELFSATKHTISLLQERRTALIAAAVTGKLGIQE